jgi:hypothetical protein
VRWRNERKNGWKREEALPNQIKPQRKKLNDWSENRAGEEDQRHFGVF